MSGIFENLGIDSGIIIIILLILTIFLLVRNISMNMRLSLNWIPLHRNSAALSSGDHLLLCQ